MNRSILLPRTRALFFEVFRFRSFRRTLHSLVFIELTPQLDSMWPGQSMADIQILSFSNFKPTSFSHSVFSFCSTSVKWYSTDPSDKINQSSLNANVLPIPTKRLSIAFKFRRHCCQIIRSFNATESSCCFFRTVRHIGVWFKSSVLKRALPIFAPMLLLLAQSAYPFSAFDIYF